MEFVALLRGVNVGGVKVAMADLKRIATGLGWARPETFIASGNLMFSAPEGDHGPALEAALVAEYGREVPVLVRGAGAFRAMLGECPFDPEEGNQVHGFLPFGPFALDDPLYRRLKRDSESVVLTERAAWLHAPEGIGRSDLAARMEKVLGTTATARNLNTLRRLAELLDVRSGG